MELKKNIKCKECKKEIIKKRSNHIFCSSKCKDRNYRKENKDKLKKYYEENKERISRNKRNYRKENKDKIREVGRKWRLANKDKLKEYGKKGYRKNREKILERQRKWQKERGNKLWSERYKNDKDFKIKTQIRNKTVRKFSLKNKSCEMCGNKEDLQRHHLDYSDPYKILILCRQCHNKIHSISKS